MAKTANKIVVTKAEDVPTEVLADSIVSIAQSMKKLRAGRLTDKALFLLIQHAAPKPSHGVGGQVTQAHIRAVFEGIESLEATFLKKQRA